MATHAPLPMSQSKEDLLRHLNMDADTYAMMSKETDRYYKWLTQDRRHLKQNCKGKPPYDWSDINEKSKDEAITYISRSGNTHTSYYWDLAAPTDDCPNWIARWFLYHKFRYRDGRNRNLPSSHKSSHHSSSSGSASSSQYYQPTAASSSSYYQSSSGASGSTSRYYSQGGSSSSSYISANSASYGSTQYQTNSNTYQNAQAYGTYDQDDQQGSRYYDPVRDARDQ